MQRSLILCGHEICSARLYQPLFVRRAEIVTFFSRHTGFPKANRQLQAFFQQGAVYLSISRQDGLSGDFHGGLSCEPHREKVLHHMNSITRSEFCHVICEQFVIHSYSVVYAIDCSEVADF